MDHCRVHWMVGHGQGKPQRCMGRGIYGWCAMNAVGQGDCCIEGSVDGEPWTLLARETYGLRSLWMVGHGRGKSGQDVSRMFLVREMYGQWSL